MIPVILAGGSGSRLWPLSREKFPKQFLKLTGSLTMLQSTLSRLNNLNADDSIVICNEEHRFIVAEQLRELGKLSNNIILEPKGRNTAPAITLAALAAKRKFADEDPLILILAADHNIQDEHVFCEAINKASSLASYG